MESSETESDISWGSFRTPKVGTVWIFEVGGPFGTADSCMED